ncbi:rhomboid family intramembrane serine protease [Croceivirga thetidis]|uniref:Rhomboid family intramembrane serine protease n=1 Tax=Croceivirga thetidis TaxID=2721623 RepID=A0ABX1GTI9_9FLAO|nr:rhomboid family intramembrane serine protease [Croceivirga thetidis]NKI33241.1 rhomboid family intramembrane serine protease [Croceivirga thetidis]
MSQNQDFKFSNSVLFVPFFSMLLIWVVYWLELKLGVNFNEYGVYPRKIGGLVGVLCSPFIHGSREHLYNNTIPLVVLTAATFYFYRSVAWKVMVFGILISGFLTWIIGRPSFHIGASGLIYVLVSFIFFKGIFTKHFRLIALSLAVVFLYGSMIWYIFPIEEGISWEGHLSGFVVGFVMAYFLKTTVPKEKKFAWEKEDYNEEEDEFMRHFDADGNFIENADSQDEFIINYEFKKDQTKKD